MLLRPNRQEGVFIGAHAVSEGRLTRRQLADGPYVRVLHGVYADVSVARDHLLRCRAAALLMPPAAVIGGRSAAALLGAPAPEWRDPVTVVLPEPHKWRGPEGVRVHRGHLSPGEVRGDGYGLRWTAPLRTAWDVAVLETTATAVGVVDAMLRAELIGVPEMDDLLRGRVGRRGSRRFRRVVELADGRSESLPESTVRVACHLGGLPAPVPQYEVVERDRWLARVDLAWPDLKVAVEYDGEHHFEDGRIPKDDARLARLTAAGWLVIRLAAPDLRRLDDVVDRIRVALSERSART
ncbi:endonuclease domain-containing protein [Geodermatophilus sp. FMUSA9-8]|uniref:endonuclease domain-containing protein n=1 Tax=Geodermatophilus sp. FMUSA9-8 TaxID=3120155 RepID=UPI0030080434